MAGIVGPRSSSFTHVDPVRAHVAHLRHLTKRRTTELVLRKRHEFKIGDARDTAPIVGAHIEQALEFHLASLTADARTRAVLQYYCYLNLAVSVILVYRPSNYNKHGSHGVRDTTSTIASLDLSSVVAQISRGAVPLFHDVLSDAPLVKGTRVRLRELLVAIPMIQTELGDALGVETRRIFVGERLRKINSGICSELRFTVVSKEGAPCKMTHSLRRKLERALPTLVRDYSKFQFSRERLVYLSNKWWPVGDERKAHEGHRKLCFRCVNFGGHSEREYQWLELPRVPLLPTLTSCLLFSFVLSSIARYRPVLASRVENSQMNLIVDTYIQESDAMFLPAIRNLLYREEMYIRLETASG